MAVDYVVYRTPMLWHQDGERYTEETDGGPTWEELHKTLEDAVAAADDVPLDEPNVHRAKRGLDAVTYEHASVVRYEYESEDDRDEGEVVYLRSTLNDEWEKALNRHQQAYWDFLDYKEDGYLHVDECYQALRHESIQQH